MIILLRYQLKSFSKVFRDRDFTVLFVASAFILVGIGVAVAAYIGFFCGFKYLSGEASFCRFPQVLDQPYFADAITLYVLEMFFTIIFALILLAAAITALPVFFFSRDLSWLLSSPLRIGEIFRAKYPLFRMLILWPILILGIPGIIALGVSRGQDLSYYAISIAALGVFLRGIEALGILFVFVAIRLLKKIPRPLIGVLGILAIALGSFLLAQVTYPHAIVETFRAQDLSLTKAPLEPIERLFRYSPSHAVAEAIMRAALGEHERAMGWLLILLTKTLVLVALAMLAVKMFYRAMLWDLSEGTFIARPEDMRTNRLHAPFPPRLGRSFPRFFSGQIGVLLEKDLMGLMRNARELASAGFLIFLLLLYLFLLIGLPLREVRVSSLLPGLLALHIAGLGYFATTLGLRFLFPLIGREGQHGWIVFSSPVSAKKIFLGKFLFSFVALLILISGLETLTLPLFDLPQLLFFFLLALGILLALTLSSLMIGIGSLSPELRKRDPERMSTTPAGLLATFLALLFVGLIAATAFAVTRSFAASTAFPWLLVLLSGIAALGSVVLAFTMIPQRLARQDF